MTTTGVAAPALEVRNISAGYGGTTVLLTTQYLDEAELLADRIAILHEGTVLVNGTLAELKKLLPPAKRCKTSNEEPWRMKSNDKPNVCERG